MPPLRIHESPSLNIYSAITDTELSLPLATSKVSAGFPSPASDFTDVSIDLNKDLIKHPASTYFGRVRGDSMKDVGIFDNDLLVIDKSLEPADGKIAVCFIDGEFTVKRIQLTKEGCCLMPANSSYQPIPVTKDNEFVIWGIVTHVIKSF